MTVIHGMKSNAISGVVSVSIVAILIAIVGFGAYVAYSSGDLTGATSSSSSLNNCISLSGFSLDAATSNVSGTVVVNGRSALIQMDLYINGTLMGSKNYTGMVSSGMYSMIFSADPQTMPKMSTMSITAGRSYMVMMTAMFSDGTRCNASSTMVAAQMMTSGTMMQSTSSQSMMSSSGMMIFSSTQTMMSTSGMMSSTSSNQMMTTSQMINTTSNMMGR